MWVCMRGTCASPLPIYCMGSAGIHSMRVMTSAKAKHGLSAVEGVLVPLVRILSFISNHH